MTYIGADHRGYELKEKLKKYLEELGYQYEDMGAFEYNKADDFPDFANAVAQKVALKEENRGILICGSGIGVAVAANKVRGVRAGTPSGIEQLKASVNDESLNVLAISHDFGSEELAKEMVKTFLETPFGRDERYLRRLNKIKALEKN